jgi:hypothetical protein
LKTQLQKAASSPLSPDVANVMQLKDKISQLEEEASKLRQTVLVEKESQIRVLQQEKASLEEKNKVLDLMAKSFGDDLGKGKSRESKDLAEHLRLLQEKDAKNSTLLTERDNTIMELRFDREELTHKVARLEGRITDLETLVTLHTHTQGQGNGAIGATKDVTELQNVVTSLRRVIDKLKTENLALQKAVNSKENAKQTAVPTKAMSDVESRNLMTENVLLKKKLKDAEDKRSRPGTQETDTERVKELTKQVALVSNQKNIIDGCECANCKKVEGATANTGSST